MVQFLNREIKSITITNSLEKFEKKLAQRSNSQIRRYHLSLSTCQTGLSIAWLCSVDLSLPALSLSLFVSFRLRMYNQMLERGTQLRNRQIKPTGKNNTGCCQITPNSSRLEAHPIPPFVSVFADANRQFTKWNIQFIRVWVKIVFFSTVVSILTVYNNIARQIVQLVPAMWARFTIVKRLVLWFCFGANYTGTPSVMKRYCIVL